jgi:hypothetical protein
MFMSSMVEMAGLLLAGAGLGWVLTSTSPLRRDGWRCVWGSKCATAEITGHGFVDIGIGGMRFLNVQRGGGHDLSGLAVAALRDLFSDPGFLDRM